MTSIFFFFEHCFGVYANGTDWITQSVSHTFKSVFALKQTSQLSLRQLLLEVNNQTKQ